jgi:hypothetical protein
MLAPSRNRVELTDTPPSMMAKMADGNIGALTVMLALWKDTHTIDPQSALEGLGPILALDDMGIYGSHIWILYKDICGQDLRNLIGVLRARNLGHCSGNDILQAIATRESSNRRGEITLDVPALVAKVVADLTEFQK